VRSVEELDRRGVGEIPESERKVVEVVSTIIVSSIVVSTIIV